MFARFEVVFKNLDLDSKSQSVSTRFSASLKCIEVFWVKASSVALIELSAAAKEILIDPILHLPSLEARHEGAVFERIFHPGMTDNRARTLKEALHLFFPDADDLEVLSGDLILVENGKVSSGNLLRSKLEKKWVNPWIHSFRAFDEGSFNSATRFTENEIRKYFREIDPTAPKTGEVVLAGLSEDKLSELSQARLWALSLEEMKVIQSYFISENRVATDVELEIIAQTWSEHCKHKIFGADVAYTGTTAPDGFEIPSNIKSLFKTTIANTTSDNPKPWLLSVFKDNAGIVAFNDEDALCLKVETHNSPSALDPFGGAITGIVGVNRDILGTGIGARPTFNTNVFCVGPTGFKGSIPENMHHPRDLLEGVRLGVEDGGNQSGIPTVNGAVFFDESYMGKPLIFVGSGGYMPRKINGRPIEEKKAFPGDQIYMVGGRIGKDGIHGATFSSLQLTDQMPSSVVQLGDPITQKRMTDFLLKARDQGLIQALTDNGAGGLSSSVGEIAQLTGGAKIELANAKSKYPGMAAWELVVSESQERMTLVVRSEHKLNFEKLADLFEVEISNLGEMNASGFFEVLFHGETVSKLPLHFLHEQCPKLKLNATWSGVGLKRSTALKNIPKENGRVSGGEAAIKLETKESTTEKIVDTLKKFISDPNIASKEWIIRQYDHEVQGCSVIKPLQTSVLGSVSKKPRSSPNNAGVQHIKVGSEMGSVISCGLNPLLSLVDPYVMAQAAVDEAVRNALCVGAEFSSENPEAVFSLIDNFCWPDPTQDSEMMGALVRTCFGMRAAAMELKLPFISGKDSMKNDFRGVWDGKAVHIAVLPTLLISALGRIKDVSRARSSEFKTAGDLIYLIGPSEEVYQPRPNWKVAKEVYNWLGSPQSQVLKSLHDLSDGGLLVAIAESGFSKNLGCELFVKGDQNSLEFWFGEGFHRFVGTISSIDQANMEAEWKKLNIPFLPIGKVSENSEISTKGNLDGSGGWSVNLEILYPLWEKGAQS